ncbi:MAG: Maf family protein [Bacteroidia bacterium]|nr:Maf family protein [Bacteroidia bacterium]
MKVILASASPRRKALLSLLGWKVEVRPTQVSEEGFLDLPPRERAMSLAARKISALIPVLNRDEVGIAADTLVYHAGQVLGKPANQEEARALLRRLSGEWHQVYTGLAVATWERLWLFVEETAVRFHRLSEELIEIYLASGSYVDKAGGYGAQDFIGLVGIAEIRGDFYNVMGLPVQRLLQFWYQTFGRYYP